MMRMYKKGGVGGVGNAMKVGPKVGKGTNTMVRYCGSVGHIEFCKLSKPRKVINARKKHCATTTRTRHPVHMSSDASHPVTTDANGDVATANTPASLADAGKAFPRLPNHLVVEHILRSEHFDDPADLARLPAVSRTMRDAVAETGLRFV
jgi:hypothetical protein